MHHVALLALQGPQVAEAAGSLSPDAKWILIALGSGALMLFSFLGRIAFALLDPAKAALLGVSRLPAAIDGVKAELTDVKDTLSQEIRETRVAFGVLKVEMREEVVRLGGAFTELTNVVLDRRVSDMAKTSAAALALAQGSIPESHVPDFSEEDADPGSSSPRRALSPRVPRPRPASSPALGESASRSSRSR